ncbi:TetR/AcrR family transcriptional regulator [Blastococcus sp. CT_GayMR16]|uniref:TetR/AcrR family transcriptional regulator n=1 Tax=Blastococcus sp. CT_GayMR16 TaxID=2559607 RepID=UPI0010736EB3|nr:TetR/AcrR family transcriptional regulator [Blastococcus sp. CT_GayMR16]TFV88885.1 TetR/AcrR family transcriptional regulator [Blastococcus sp. CT_GayMR16]
MTETVEVAGTIRVRLDEALLDYLRSVHGDGALGEISVDAVAQAAGVSRATAYRYLGSRDELLYRAAIMLAEAHMGRCEEILSRTATVADRLEEAFAYTVRETTGDELLQLLLRSPRAEAIDEALRAMTGDLFSEAVRAGQEDGQVRTDVSAPELIAWQVEQLYVVVRLALDEEQARSYVRRFMVPALRPAGEPDAGLKPHVRAVLDDVHRRLQDLDRSVGRARSALDD